MKCYNLLNRCRSEHYCKFIFTIIPSFQIKKWRHRALSILGKIIHLIGGRAGIEDLEVWPCGLGSLVLHYITSARN